eukprot:14215940-Ditylum_brightwellii.AAC.1
MVKRGKTNGKVELNTEEELPEEENPSAADMMKACGETALDQESVYKTDIKVEWKMKNGRARVTKAYYKNPDKIPMGNIFSKAFTTKQNYERDNAPLITIFLTVNSNLCVNTIKYDDRVFNYIGHHSCYINPDHFSCSNVVSPGMIFGAHPTLIYIEAYKTEVESIISQWPAPQNDI